jgi:hypothetical protein
MKSDRVRRARRNNAPPLVVEENMKTLRAVARGPFDFASRAHLMYNSLARPIYLTCSPH